MHVLDIIVIVLLMLMFVALGYYFKLKKNATSTEYFLSKKELSPVIVAASISVSYISANAMTVAAGEIYTYGLPHYLALPANILVPVLVNTYVVPYFYNKDYISIYQFLEERFSKAIRPFFSFMFVITSLMSVSISVYVTSIAAEMLTGIPFWVSALAVGGISTVYSAMGGLRAVVWTDLCQAFLILLFGLIMLGKLLSSFDSWSDAWSTAVRGKRLWISISEGPTVRYGFFSMTAMWITHWLYCHCMSQVGVQRWKSVPSVRDAKLTVWLSTTFVSMFFLILYGIGVALYVFYDGCDLVLAKKVRTADHITLYFLQTELSKYPGVVGICLVGIFSGALSTFSSYVNSFAAVTLEDFIKIKYKSMKNETEILLCKGLSAFYGIFCTALVFLVAQSKSVIVISWIAHGIFTGPSLGTLFLGLWCKKANTKGVSLGLLCSLALMLWLSWMSLLYGNKNHEKLPTDVSRCSVLNNSGKGELDLENTTWWESTELLKDSAHNEKGFENATWWETTELPEVKKPLSKVENGSFFYGISFAWFGTIGLFSSLFFGIIFSLANDFITKKIFGRMETETPTDHYTDLRTMINDKEVVSQEMEPLQQIEKIARTEV